MWIGHGVLCVKVLEMGRWFWIIQMGPNFIRRVPVKEGRGPLDTQGKVMWPQQKEDMIISPGCQQLPEKAANRSSLDLPEGSNLAHT